MCGGLALTSDRPTLLVDLAGDLGFALGVDDTERPGVGDWLRTDVSADRLDELTTDIAPGRGLVLRGAEPTGDLDRWRTLAGWLSRWEADRSGAVVIDAGTRSLPAPFVEACTSRLLVTRACYLALRRVRTLAVAPTGVVLVVEPGRGIGVDDVERSCGAPVLATVPWDPNIARAVDAGLLASGRLPRVLRRSVRRVA